MPFIYARNNYVLLTLLVCFTAFNCSNSEKNQSTTPAQSPKSNVVIPTDNAERQSTIKQAGTILQKNFLLDCSNENKTLSFSLFGEEKKTLIEFENFEIRWEEENLTPETSANNITFLGKMVIQLHDPTNTDESKWRMIRSYNEQKHSWDDFKIPFNEEQRKRYNLPAYIRVMKRNGDIKFEKNGNWVTFQNFNFQKPNLACSAIKSNSLSEQNEEVLFGKKMNSSTSSTDNSNSSSNTTVTSTPYNINAMEEEQSRLRKKEEEKDKKDVTELAKTFIETKAKCGEKYYWIKKNGLVYEFSSYQMVNVNRIEPIIGSVVAEVNYISYDTKTYLKGRTNSLPAYRFWMRYMKVGKDWIPRGATLSLPDCDTIESQIQ